MEYSNDKILTIRLKFQDYLLLEKISNRFGIAVSSYLKFMGLRHARSEIDKYMQTRTVPQSSQTIKQPTISPNG